ncbi:MAG: TIM-barrel domain-containing protein, partial [Planctomycetota bacterium]
MYQVDKYRIIIGSVRVQVLSETLLRLEEKGVKGFEDRVTFTVVNRKWQAVKFKAAKKEKHVILSTNNYIVKLPYPCFSLKGVQVLLPDGKVIYEHNGTLPDNNYLPSPGVLSPVWIMADAPRIVPPEWEATPAPRKTMQQNSGWDITNNTPDIYIFIPGKAGYPQLRKDFLTLTGRIPIPPLFTLGLIDSKYHPYSEQTALETIDTYRKKCIPLDVFVVDTDWRVGASHGYEINTKLFPNMKRFITEAHKRNVKLMFNDHPEPICEAALSDKELRYRKKGLFSLLKLGADIWWYDRNWDVGLKEPHPGMRKEVWGMRLYHDITRQFRPKRRPLIMSNIDGIDHAHKRYASHPSAHRYPIWWTGDTISEWEYLKRGIENGVDCGVLSLLPYVSEDLGGHCGTPSAELYTRFVQYGALSPICRLHCTQGESRYPWAFGKDTEKIVASYIKLRYRLLPVIYSAARQAHEDGTPVLRRCDLYWYNHKKASTNSQYMLGDDLLVAPIYTTMQPILETISSKFLKTPDSKTGLLGEYFE